MELIVNNLRRHFNTNITKTYKWRIQQLNSIERMLIDNESQICESLRKDLNKPEHETIGYEIVLCKAALVHFYNNLSDYMKPQKVHPSLALRPLVSTAVEYQPYGVTLILGAWNYPIQLTLVPIIGAIASGNCVVLKPSELNVNTSKLLQDLLPKYLDNKAISVINGGIPETTELLKQRFDYIFYTGNTAVGKIIMRAAAEHMTPVTLECGGKSPVFIDETADLNVTARRLLWGKFVNAGQTCVAPDYILCSKSIQDKLLPIMKKILNEFYGNNPVESKDYTRIVNERHVKRLESLMDKSKIVYGGDINENDCYISPTIMFNVDENDKIMGEEIFGPILPFVQCDNYRDAIDFINRREKPLALYVFTKDSHVFGTIKAETSSGACLQNQVLMHGGVEDLPFGGVGNSGIGQYHGKFSFETFSHKRAVLTSNFFGDSLSGFIYPPYNSFKTKQIQMIGEFKQNFITRTLSSVYLYLALGVGGGLAYYHSFYQ